MNVEPRRRRTTRVDLATSYAADESADEQIVVPEDLSTLTDEELSALSERAETAFDSLYGDGTADLSAEDLEALRGLGAAIQRLNEEAGTREAAVEARRAEAAELAAAIRPPAEEEIPEEGDDPEGGEDDDNADPHTDEVEEVVVPDDASEITDQEPALTAGAPAPSGPLSITVRGANARRPRQQAPAPTRQRTLRDVAFATTDLLGFGMNAAVDFNDAGAMLDTALARLPLSQYQSAAARGQHMRETSPLMAVKRPMPRDLVVSKTLSVEDAMKRATDQSRLPGGALTAAGWCSPSDNLYDLVYGAASRDGLLSIPEVGVGRGGINVPMAPTFADIYAQIGFHFTEAQAAAGQYAPGGAGSARANTTAVALGDIRTWGGAIFQVIVAGTTGGSAPAVPTSIGQTVTDGSVTWRRVATTANVAGDKPCYEIECPDWEDYRLEGDGLCLIADILMMRGYPEMLAMVTAQALIAHDHKVSAGRIAKLVAGSTFIQMATDTVGTVAPLLAAIELQVEHYRYSRRLSRNTLLEAVFPFWVHGAIRQDLSVRLGLALFDVTNEMINGWFRQRGIVPQFVYDWQALDTSTAANFKQWPATVQFLLYQAGTWVGGVDDIITLNNLYDSTMLGQNKYTALFTEEAWLVAKRDSDSRLIQVPVVSDGSVHAGVLLDADLGAA